MWGVDLPHAFHIIRARPREQNKNNTEEADPGGIRPRVCGKSCGCGGGLGVPGHRADVVSAPAGDGVGTAAPVAEALAYFHGIASFPRVLRSLGPPGFVSSCPTVNSSTPDLLSQISWPDHTDL